MHLSSGQVLTKALAARLRDYLSCPVRLQMPLLGHSSRALFFIAFFILFLILIYACYCFRCRSTLILNACVLQIENEEALQTRGSAQILNSKKWLFRLPECFLCTLNHSFGFLALCGFSMRGFLLSRPLIKSQNKERRIN